nr:MAG TPA: hypothetical protein [Caudoviricetes sp.]
MKEQAFLFYQRWREQMKRLPDNERLLIYDAICDYAFENKESNLAYYLESILDNIRLTINENRAKQQAFIELQKEKSRKGVEARNRKKSLGNPTQPTGNPRVTTDNPTQPNNKNKKENKNKKDNIDSSLHSESTSTEAVDPETESDGKITIVKSDEEKENREYCNKVAKYFNEQMQGRQVKKIVRLNQSRMSQILARTKEYGKEAVAQVIVKTANSNFLNGDNNRGFLATFDWIFRPTNFPKIYEGNYDNRTSIQRSTSAAADNGRAQRDAAWRAYAMQRLQAANSESEEIPEALRDI